MVREGEGASYAGHILSLGDQENRDRACNASVVIPYIDQTLLTLYSTRLCRNNFHSSGGLVHHYYVLALSSLRSRAEVQCEGHMHARAHP